MKIGNERIPGLIMKTLASGAIFYGWEPTPRQRDAGWKSKKLDGPLEVAIRQAKEQNETIGKWRDGGARPAQIKRFVKVATFDYVLTRYEVEVLATKSANTQRVDRTAIGRLRVWAGDKPWQWITRARVKALRDAMMRHATIDGPGHAPAFHLLTTLRKILSWWIDEQDLGIPNPADRFGLAAPAPREQIWTREAQDYLVAAAIEVDMPSIDLAFRIATYIGQRENDVIDLQRARWKEISLAQLGHDQELYDRLVSDHGPDAGRVMGLYVKQGKTKRWVGVPIEGALRDDIEAAIAANIQRARAENRVVPQHIIIAEHTGEPWGQSDFIHKFACIRELAAANARADGLDDLAEEILDLNFQDCRRTCVVTLGILGLNDYQIASITGHKQETIKKILEVYMPRTEAAAARGVVARIGQRPRRGEQLEKQA